MIPGEPDIGADARQRREERLVELQPRLHLYFRLKLSDGQRVKDAVQETNLRVLARIDSRSDDANFDAHIFTVARLVFLELIRPAREQSEGVGPDETDDDAMEGLSIRTPLSAAPSRRDNGDFSIRLSSSGEQVQMSALFPFLWQCVDQLRGAEAALFGLRWGPGSSELTSRAVGERLGVNAAAVDNRAARLKRKLEECAKARHASDRNSAHPHSNA